MVKLPRSLHKLYAHVFGYFWLPCPLCGRMFGGHEWGTGDYVMTSWSSGYGVCSNCHDAAKAYNDEWMKNNPPPELSLNLGGVTP